MMRLGSISAVMMLGLVACDPATTEDTSNDDPVGGGCDQICQDQMTSWSVTSTVWFLYNQNFAGSPVGGQDRSGSCPHGGTFHITGSTGYDQYNNIGTVHLVYDLSGCRNVSTTSDLSVDVTHTGLVQQDGTFTGGGPSIAITYQSSPLTFDGEIFGAWSSEGTLVSDVCPVSLSETSSSTTGTICSRSAAY
jgi:hypothetical protein